MKPNIKHPLLTLLGLSIGFVVTLEAAAGPSVTVPGYSCTSSSGEAFRYNSAGAYEARDRNSRVAVVKGSVYLIYDILPSTLKIRPLKFRQGMLSVSIKWRSSYF